MIVDQITNWKAITMKLLTDLFSTDYGIMTVVGISFMLGMGVFFLWLFTSNMKRDAERAGESTSTTSSMN